MATPRDAAHQLPSVGGVFPAASPKPVERATAALLAFLNAQNQNPEKAVASLPRADAALIEQHAQPFFKRSKEVGAAGMAHALVLGLRQHEFGKSPLEIVNLLVFVQGATGTGASFDLTGASRALIT